MHPPFKKFSLLKDSPAPIATDHTTDGGSEVLLSDSTSPQINYYHVVETWKCLGCNYEGFDIEFIYRSRIVEQTDNTSSSIITTHCPECDSENIKRPDRPEIKCSAID